MKRDTQKPILFKAEPDLFSHLENFKDSDSWRWNRNEFLNDAVRLYIEFVKLMNEPEYAYLNEDSFNESRLQRILFERLKIISHKYPPARFKRKFG